METRFFNFNTKGYTDIINITDKIQDELANVALQEGHCLISIIGSTAGLSTVEYEPGLVNNDVGEMLDKIAPYGVNYKHNQTWGDDNGAAHLRSTLVGTSYTVPFRKGKLLLGTWQQIVLLDFDTRPRKREVVAQFNGV